MSRLEYPFDPRWVDWEPRQSTIIRLPATRGVRPKIARNRDKSWYKALIRQISQIVEILDLLPGDVILQMTQEDLINLYEDLGWEFEKVPPRNVPDDMVISAVAHALDSLSLSPSYCCGYAKA